MKRLLLVLLFLGMFSFQHCSRCNCPAIDGEYFDIAAMNMYHMSKSNSTNFEGELLSASDYEGLRMVFEVEYLAHVHSSPLFGSSAYACSCVQNGDAGSKHEQLEEISIITLTDLPPNYSANDTVNDLFLVDLYGDQFSIQDFIDTLGENVPYTQFDFLLKEDLAKGSEVQFQVEVLFSPTEFHVGTTDLLTLN